MYHSPAYHLLSFFDKPIESPYLFWVYGVSKHSHVLMKLGVFLFACLVLPMLLLEGQAKLVQLLLVLLLLVYLRLELFFQGVDVNGGGVFHGGQLLEVLYMSSMHGKNVEFSQISSHALENVLLKENLSNFEGNLSFRWIFLSFTLFLKMCKQIIFLMKIMTT